MGVRSVVVDLPEETYECVGRAARALRQPVQQALTWMVEASLPSLARVPPEERPQLAALESADDDGLWAVAQGEMPPHLQNRMEQLLAERSERRLSAEEARELHDLQEEADALTLRKSYAYVLLKWRGHDVGRPKGF